MMKLKKKLIFYLKTARVYLYYHLNEKFPKISKLFHIRTIPFIIVIIVTNKCNLKCKYCDVWKLNNKRELTINKLRKLIDDIARMGVPYISLTGGEPLLIKDIELIGAYAMKKNVVINLNTNGILINKKRALKVAKSFNYVRISLDGLEKMHDELSGVSGTFQKVRMAINNLRFVPNKTAKVGLNYVLTSNNQFNMTGFIQKLKDEVDFISYLPEFSFGCKSNHNPLVSKDLNKNLKDLEKIKKSGNSPEFIFKYNINNSKKICDAGKLYFIISSKGNLYPCPFIPKHNYWEYSLGSCFKNNLSDLINFKNNFNYSKICFGCHANCTTEISRIMRMSPLKLIKNFIKLKKTYHI